MCYAFSGPKSEREEGVEVRNGARPHTRESELYPTGLEKEGVSRKKEQQTKTNDFLFLPLLSSPIC